MDARQNIVILPYTLPCPTPTVRANVLGDEDGHQAPLKSEPETSPFRACPHPSESQPSPKAPAQQGAPYSSYQV